MLLDLLRYIKGCEFWSKAIARSFDPKGFWRVDKDKSPELRHTVLSPIAFQELTAIGLEAFINLNDSEGWLYSPKLCDWQIMA